MLVFVQELDEICLLLFFVGYSGCYMGESFFTKNRMKDEMWNGRLVWMEVFIIAS